MELCNRLCPEVHVDPEERRVKVTSVSTMVSCDSGEVPFGNK